MNNLQPRPRLRQPRILLETAVNSTIVHAFFACDERDLGKDTEPEGGGDGVVGEEVCGVERGRRRFGRFRCGLGR